MKENFKSNYVCQFGEILSKFDEQKGKQKTVGLSRENWLTCVEMHAYRGCLEAGSETSKPAEVAFMLMSSTQRAHPPATTSKPLHVPFKILLIFKNKFIGHHNERILIFCQHMAPSFRKIAGHFLHWLVLTK